MRAVVAAVLLSIAAGIPEGFAQGSSRSPDDTTQATEASPTDEDQPGRSNAGSQFVGRTLPQGHWAVEAVERARVLLLLPDWLPGQRAVPLDLVEASLREAALAAEVHNPTMLPVVEGWYRRLLEEFPGLVTEDREPGLRLIQHAVGVAFDSREGVAAPGQGEFEPDRTGATRTGLIWRGDGDCGDCGVPEW